MRVKAKRELANGVYVRACTAMQWMMFVVVGDHDTVAEEVYLYMYSET